MDEIKHDNAALAEEGDGKPMKDTTATGAENAIVEVPRTTDSSALLSQSPALSAQVQSITDKALHFLSHASNETLGACLAGLGATTYFVLGRFGLVIIGVAGGIVLHATWEGIRNDDRDEATRKADRERKKETGLDVMRRVLDWRSKSIDFAPTEDTRVYANQTLDFSGFEPATAAALNTFTNAIIKDYVHYWYDPTLPGEDSFPASCKRTLTAFLLSLSGHLQRKRPADAFLDFVTNASSIIIVFLNELAVALNSSPHHSADEAVAFYLQMKPDSNLAHVLDTKHQDSKLSMVAEDILQAYLDPKAYNCPPVHAFLKQVLAQLVLGYTITMCSEPSWINEWIVYGLEESETTKEVMDLVDAGVDGRAANESGKGTDKVTGKEDIKSKKDSATGSARPEHKRQMSRAEEAMDDAMQEARRLTQLMIEEDEKRQREEQEKHAAASSSEDVSDAATHGAPTPTSSDSDRGRQSQEAETWSEEEPQGVGTEERPATPTTKQPFTSFDQILPSNQPTALTNSPERARREPPQLTLHNATISIFDDSQPGERTAIKSKPTVDYLIQIEPSSSAFPGWMIARKYADFETLHEVLRRVSVITGQHFHDTHSELPKWRTQTKPQLRQELERYLTDAVRFQPLAESEGMKRFLEKDQGLAKSPSERNKGFGWPTPDAFGKFGGDMINVLAKAPKEVAGGVTGGGKALFGGVAGLVKKGNQSRADLSRTNSGTVASTTSSPAAGVHKSQPSMADNQFGSISAGRQSQDSLRSMPKPARDRRESASTVGSAEPRTRPNQSPQPSRASNESSRTPPVAPTAETTPAPVRPTMTQEPSYRPHLPGAWQSYGPAPGGQAVAVSTASPAHPATRGVEEAFNLPPPPSEISDDYGFPTQNERTSTDTFRSSNVDQRTSTSTAPTSIDMEQPPIPQMPPRPRKNATAKPPITEQEASVAVELMFAVITELYTLSSAWQIRRTLLTAAKTYLLRPGNPQLATICDMLQTSMLDSNLSDEGIAKHVYKLRESALPTAEEMEIWTRDYPPKTAEQKEELRIKARYLLVTKGMPQALTSVMGAAASGEALGKVFDCLQVPEVSRGLVFGLLLQALKVITH